MKGIEVPDKHSHKKALRKIPPTIIKNCYGIAVFTSMRSGIAPLGGAGGNGLVVAHDPQTGWWSPPACISPNNMSAGLLLGVDIFDCVLVLNSQKALDTFGTHKVTLGAELAVAAGPWGAGASMESGKEGAPVFSYIKSRGLYAGVEAIGQVFLSRFDENERVYHWPGVKARDILTGHVKMPREAQPFIKALEDAACGKAQLREGPPPEDPMFRIAPIASGITLEDGEVLKLPPTPDMTDGHEHESDPETERVIRRMTLPSDFRPPPVEKRWTPPLPPPRHGSAGLHHPAPRRAGLAGTPPPPVLPPRRNPSTDVDSSSPLAGPSTAPLPLDPNLPPTPTSPDTLPTVINVAATKPPPLPPRSRHRPPSMAVPHTPVTPTSFVAEPQVAAVSETPEAPFDSTLVDATSAFVPPPGYEATRAPVEEGSALTAAEPEADDLLADHIADEHATAQAFADLRFDDVDPQPVVPQPALDISPEPEFATLAYDHPSDGEKPHEPAQEPKEEPRSQESQESSQESSQPEEKKEQQAQSSDAKSEEDKLELPKNFDFSRLRGEAGNLGFRG